MGKIKRLTGKASDFSGIVLKAAARGDLVSVKHFLKKNPAWLNQEGPHGRTMLWEATYKGRLETVKELIKRGASVHPLGSYYTPMLVELSPLAVAVAAERTELVALLKKHGAKDDIYAACHRGDLKAIKSFLAKKKAKLINKPAKDRPPSPRMGWNPIHYAVAGKQLEAVKLLANEGAEIVEHIHLLLDWAEGDKAIVKFLRSKTKGKKLPKQVFAFQEQATKKASPKGKIPAIDRPNWLGFPELVDACRGNHNAQDHPERVQPLLDRGANVNVIDYKGKTPLHRACQAGFLKITKLLLDNKAGIEIADDKGWTPLFDAAYHGRTETIALMLKHKANLHHTNKQNETVLFAAARQGRYDAVALLLKKKAKRQQQNKRGLTIVEVIEAKPTSDVRKKIIRLLKRKP